MLVFTVAIPAAEEDHIPPEIGWFNCIVTPSVTVESPVIDGKYPATKLLKLPVKDKFEIVPFCEEDTKLLSVDRALLFPFWIPWLKL